MTAFEVFSTPSAGRGLRATRTIQAGEEVLCESPAFMVQSEGKTDEEELHECLAHMVALRTSDSDLFQRLEARVDDHNRAARAEALAAGGPVSRWFEERWSGAAAAKAISESIVLSAYCKHQLNSFAIYLSDSVGRIGSGLVGRHARAIGDIPVRVSAQGASRANGRSLLPAHSFPRRRT